MSLHQDIRAQVKEAMIAKDAERLNVLRGLLSSFTNEAISKGKRPDEELTDDAVLTVISRAVKQRKDSIEQFEKGGRADLADAEKSELVILEKFLPEQMSEEEIVKFVQAKQAELNYPKDKAGQLTGQVMKDLKGKADGTLVKKAVDSLFE